MRRFVYDFIARGLVPWHFFVGFIIDTGRDLFYNQNKSAAESNVSGNAAYFCIKAEKTSAGCFQAFGVIIDTLVLCTCTAMIMLLAPAELIEGLAGMDLLQTAMKYHFGTAGVIFIAIVLWMFSFSTFIGILFYARSNVAYLFGDHWKSQTIFKVIAIIMLFIGGLAAYTFVWEMGDIGIGLMTIFNMIVLIPMSGEAISSLEEYCALKKKEK